MKTNENDLAFPNRGQYEDTERATGLTKREYFAAQAMIGLCVPAIAGVHNKDLPSWNSEKAKQAVNLADALIDELNK